MRGEWNLRDWEYEYYSRILRTKIEYAYRHKNEEVSLTGYDLNPQNVSDLLEYMGWEDDDFEHNGWEQDCWQHFYKDGYDTKLTVFSCGMTFKLCIVFYEEQV